MCVRVYVKADITVVGPSRDLRVRQTIEALLIGNESDEGFFTVSRPVGFEDVTRLDDIGSECVSSGENAADHVHRVWRE